MWKYLVGDPRFKSLKKKRRAVVNLWCQREFKNLKIASEAGVNCPKPIAFEENVLMMSFIGEDGIAAPRLIDIELKNPSKAYVMILEDLKKLVGNGLIHGDLSAYNILFWDKPYFIDFSHGTTIRNPLAPELLKRDLKNINSYFSKFNITLKDSEKIYKELEEIIKEKARK
jgi:RIO kinase 1